MLVLLAIILSTSTLNADIFPTKKQAEDAYIQQVEVNNVLDKSLDKELKIKIKLTEEYSKYKNTSEKNIQKYVLEKKMLKKELKNKDNWLLKIPFTNIGLTVPFAQGFLLGSLFCAVIF